MDKNEPVGIGGRLHEIPCAGNPYRPGAVLNDCGRPAEYVVIASQVLAVDHPEPVICIVGACRHHVSGVQAWMAERARDAAMLLGQEFTPDDEPIVDLASNFEAMREHFGDMAWIATRTG